MNTWLSDSAESHSTHLEQGVLTSWLHVDDLGSWAQSCELASSHWSTDPSQTITVQLSLRLVARGDRMCTTSIGHSSPPLHFGISKRHFPSSNPVGVLSTSTSPGLVRRNLTMYQLTLNTISSVCLPLSFLVIGFQRIPSLLHSQGAGLNGVVHSGG